MTSARAKEIIRNQVMRFADPADMDVGNWDICTDNILKALDEKGFAIVPKEPTFEMVKATVGPIKGAVETYKVMLTAAKETT